MTITITTCGKKHISPQITAIGKLYPALTLCRGIHSCWGDRERRKQKKKKAKEKRKKTNKPKADALVFIPEASLECEASNWLRLGSSHTLMDESIDDVSSRVLQINAQESVSRRHNRVSTSKPPNKEKTETQTDFKK